MIRAQDGFRLREGPLEQRLRVGVAPLEVIDLRQMAPRLHLEERYLSAPGQLFHDRHCALVYLFRFGVVALVLRDPGESMQDVGDVWMVWADLTFKARQGLQGKGGRLGIPPLGSGDDREVVELRGVLKRVGYPLLRALRS